MRLVFSDQGWATYLYWQEHDRRKLKKVNDLIRDIQRAPFEGLGHPEPLRFELSGCWSRHIDAEHRLVYLVEAETLTILSCRYHY